MFERFTASCIKVVMLAQEEARRMGHNHVATEQLLLGLIGEGTGIAAQTLKALKISLKEARVEVYNIIGKGSGRCAVEIPFTSGAKRALQYSWDEAREMGVNYVGTEHLLLGVVRVEEDCAAAVLENLGVSPDAIKPAVIETLNQVSGKARQVPQVDAAFIIPTNTIGKRFERFTESAMNAVKLAQEETRRTGGDGLGTEHILIGLIEEKGGIAALALESQGVTVIQARSEIEKLVGAGDGIVGAKIRFTGRAKHLIDRADEEAKRLGSNSIGSEHLLLGLLLAKGIAIQVLENLHVNLKALKAKVLELIESGGEATA